MCTKNWREKESNINNVNKLNMQMCLLFSPARVYFSQGLIIHTECYIHNEFGRSAHLCSWKQIFIGKQWVTREIFSKVIG